MAEWRYQTAPANRVHVQPYPMYAVVGTGEGKATVVLIVAWSGVWSDELKPVAEQDGKLVSLKGWHGIYVDPHKAWQVADEINGTLRF